MTNKGIMAFIATQGFPLPTRSISMTLNNVSNTTPRAKMHNITTLC